MHMQMQIMCSDSNTSRSPAKTSRALTQQTLLLCKSGVAIGVCLHRLADMNKCCTERRKELLMSGTHRFGSIRPAAAKLLDCLNRLRGRKKKKTCRERGVCPLHTLAHSRTHARKHSNHQRGTEEMEDMFEHLGEVYLIKLSLKVW